jgi:hypothetical protein
MALWVTECVGVLGGVAAQQWRRFLSLDGRCVCHGCSVPLALHGGQVDGCWRSAAVCLRPLLSTKIPIC